MSIREVEAKYIVKSLEYIRIATYEGASHLMENNLIYEAAEAYPQIGFLAEDEIYGSGITLLAFLIQESDSVACQQNIRCGDCEKDCDCEKTPGTEISFWGNTRESALDYLQFLRTKYPDLYIPGYKAEETGLDWADFLIHLNAVDFFPRIGTVGLKEACPDFSPDEQYIRRKSH